MTLSALLVFAGAMACVHHGIGWIIHEIQASFLTPRWKSEGTPCPNDLSKCPVKTTFLIEKGAVAIQVIAYFLWDPLCISLLIRTKLF